MCLIAPSDTFEEVEHHSNRWWQVVFCVVTHQPHRSVAFGSTLIVSLCAYVVITTTIDCMSSAHCEIVPLVFSLYIPGLDTLRSYHFEAYHEHYKFILMTNTHNTTLFVVVCIERIRRGTIAIVCDGMAQDPSDSDCDYVCPSTLINRCTIDFTFHVCLVPPFLIWHWKCLNDCTLSSLSISRVCNSVHHSAHFSGLTLIDWGNNANICIWLHKTQLGRKPLCPLCPLLLI